VGQAARRPETSLLILVDTSVLIAAFTSPRPLLPVIERALSAGERLVTPSIALYEWWRGPRLPHELAAHEAVFPADEVILFGVAEARIAAKLYRQIPRPRGREMDLAIAACAIARNLPLWTLNRKDFADIPGLTLARLN
jgi:predicted nucleic acid-binding protein